MLKVSAALLVLLGLFTAQNNLVLTGLSMPVSGGGSYTEAAAAKEGIVHIICDSEELSIEGFDHNPKNRCYLCKKELFTKIGEIARQRGIRKLKVVYSKEKPLTTIDDMAISCLQNCICPPGTARKCTQRRQVPGSTAFVPAVAGLIIAGEVVKDLTGVENKG